MKTLTRYLISEVVLTSLFVLAALIGLFLFFDLIAELHDLGKGTYTFGKMLLYVGLLAPRHAYEFMPIAALIGGMMALSLLNQHSEYTVMRVGGLSVARVIGILAMAGLLFASITLAIGEYLAPFSERAATQLRLSAKGQVVAQDYRSGFWLKDDRNFVNVREVLPDQTLRHVNIYLFDKERHLTSYGYAERGIWQADDSAWALSTVTLTRFDQAGVHVEQRPNQMWRSVLTPRTLADMLVAPEQMSMVSLVDYIKHLEHNQQQTGRYEIALWTKLVYPFICVAMLIIALPFAQTQRRAGGVGVKLFVGIMLGLSFYFVNQLIAHMGLLYDWSPLISAISPSLALLALALGLLYLQERR
ncbi:MAG: LPS export ABC transporter permease LptG [Burkholderiales bacterium]|nr:LPS export ABC transporter permease LptG [Burkholderiales bacterium]